MKISFDRVSSSGDLHDFSLELETMDCTVVYDPCEHLSRSILALLVGLDKIVSGKLLINDQIYENFMADRNLLSVFGYVFDEGIMLANLSIKENLLLPWRKRFEESSEMDFSDKLEYWMQLLEMKVNINHRPAMVSPAARKYLGLIRSLMTEPELLLIDDPYYLLNKTERNLLFGFLQKLKPKQDMLIASADDDFLGEIASNVVNLTSKCNL